MFLSFAQDNSVSPKDSIVGPNMQPTRLQIRLQDDSNNLVFSQYLNASFISLNTVLNVVVDLPP